MRNRFTDAENSNLNLQVHHLFGVAFDHIDGHKRVTTAEQFSIFGGSEETHDRMTETFIRTVEYLKKRGKRLEHTHPKELAEIIFKNSV